MNETCAADGMRKMEKNAENGGPISQFRQEVEVCRTASLNHIQPISVRPDSQLLALQNTMKSPQQSSFLYA